MSDDLSKALYALPSQPPRTLPPVESPLQALKGPPVPKSLLQGSIEDLQDTIATLWTKNAALEAELFSYKTTLDDMDVPEGTPLEIKLMSPYGFIDENGRPFNWQAGTVISDVLEIADLKKRGADFIVTKDAPAPEAG